MSKTNFVDGDPSQGIPGTIVPADFLNALNQHHHTGLDQDGHGALPYAADTGTANAYVVNLNPALTQYVTGMPIYFKAANANTGASTIDINGLGVKSIKKNVSTNLAAGDIPANALVQVVYDGTFFQLFSANKTAVPGGLATLNTDTRVVEPALTLYDGAGQRSASPMPSANTIPVRDANKDLGDRNGIVLWGLTGENGVSGSTAAVSLPAVSVKSGDRILLNLACSTGGAGTTSGYASLTWSGASGTVFNDLPSGSATWASSGVGSGLIWNASTMTVFKVTSDGTLTITNTVVNVGSGSPSYANRMYAIFLKKQ